MDTATLITLLGILAALLVGVVVFFIVRRLLLSTFSKPPRHNNYQRFTPPSNEPTYRMSPQTLSDTSEITIVDLPPKPRRFKGHGEDINLDGPCTLTGRSIRDCIKDCNCEEFKALRQRQGGRIY